MSLYGALFGGVSGLTSQSSKIGVISDNIANVNTVGYKESEGLFETLVVNSATSTSYQTGGVRGESRMNVDKQGLLLSTETPTDVAISGNGFFVVNAETNGGGTPLYTRAGSFRQDENGNFFNAAGFFLQGWPLDGEGRLPGEVGNTTNTTSFANLDSLETVNVESANGIALQTTLVEISANLDAGEIVYPGESVTVAMDSNNTLNDQINGEAIIVPDEYGLATANSLHRGDSFRVSTGNGLQYDYEYGGFTIGRDVTTATPTANFGDGLVNNARTYTSTAATDIVAQADMTTIQLTIPNHGLVNNDSIIVSGFAAPVGATPITDLNTTHVVTWVDANTVSITPATAHGLGVATNAAVAGTTAVDYNRYSGNIFNATTASQAFFTSTTEFTAAALTFTIATTLPDSHTFRYEANSPNTTSGQFNSLTTLASAINEVNGLTARVANGRLVVGAEDATLGVTFTNGDSTTNNGTDTGIDWISELDLQNVAASGRRFSNLSSLTSIVTADDGVTAEISNELANASVAIRVDDPLDTITVQDLADSTLLTATSTPPLTDYTVPLTVAGADIDVVVSIGAGNDATTLGITIGDSLIIQNETAALGLPATFANTPGLASVVVTAVDNVAGTFTFRIPGAYNTAGTAAAAGVATAGGTISVLTEGNQGSVVSELGITSSLAGAAYTPQTSGVLGPEYDATGAVGDNMASGDITAQFSRSFRVYDGLGAGHDLRMSYIKTDQNTWAVEVHAIPATDVSTTLVDGQVATGTLRFNGDGSLRSISSTLSAPIDIAWTNGAIDSQITFDWGTAGQPFGTAGATNIGKTDGISQFEGGGDQPNYTVNFINQNGAPVGELVGVSIDEDGFVIASYSNGESRSLYKLPIADFTNPNGLKAVSGNVFQETRESGDINLRQAGESGAGTVVSASLEQSNVELSEQLTDMIVAQRAYQSNTRVISTTDELLEQLNNL